MGNFPVVHEARTSFQSLGDTITGDRDAAVNRWNTYAEQSVIGSGIYAAVEAARGNQERAIDLGKGMGRATGSALLGGGLLRNVPGFHELATAGDSLGDVIGGGDGETASKRWNDYAEYSVIGSGVYAAVEAGRGNRKRAKELGKNMGNAAISAGVTTAAVGITLATGAAAAPLGAAAAAGAGAVVGASLSAGAAVVEQKLRSDEIKAGDVASAALMGGVGGAVAGGMAGSATVMQMVLKCIWLLAKYSLQFLQRFKRLRLLVMPTWLRWKQQVLSNELNAAVAQIEAGCTGALSLVKGLPLGQWRPV